MRPAPNAPNAPNGLNALAARTALTALVAATLLLGACDRGPAPAPAAPPPTAQAAPAAPGAEAAVELRAYPVPKGLAGELANVINSQLYRTQELAPIGRAQVGPGGQLLVTAPASVHTGIEALLARLGDAAPEAPPVVEMTYWAVTAVPLSPGAEEAPPRAPELREVAPALDVIASTEGPRRFTLIEKLSVRQVSGSEAAVEGRRLNARQSASARDGEVIADLSLRQNRGGEVRTQVSIPENKLLVLGQAGSMSEDGTTPESVYFIVRAAVVGKTGE